MDRKVIWFIFVVFSYAESLKVRRPGGWFFTGRGCGLNEKIKILREMPADTSGLTCTYVPDGDTLYRVGEGKKLVKLENP